MIKRNTTVTALIELYIEWHKKDHPETAITTDAVLWFAREFFDIEVNQGTILKRLNAMTEDGDLSRTKSHIYRYEYEFYLIP